MAMLTAADVLQWAMEIEKNGKAFYDAAGAKSADPEVRALFEDLAVQEQGHYEVFRKMLGASSAAGPSTLDHDAYQAYLQVALNKALFAGPDKALALAENAEDRESALQAAIGFEKDTLLFFYDLRDMVSDAERGTVTAIIQEEKGHLRRLADML
jgi:rubrerythrin